MQGDNRARVVAPDIWTARAERHEEAFVRLAAAADSPTEVPDPRRSDAPIEEYPPRIAPAQLAPGALEDAIESAGCALVPSLLDAEVAAELVADMDRVFEAFDRHDGQPDTGDPWFDAFVPGPATVHATRPWLRKGGGIFTVDSPRLADRWFGLLTSLGITALVTEIFGESPITSLDKCTLRRVDAGGGIEWHQDGSFLGATSGALNLWLSLTDTAAAPGLDIVSRRFTDIVATGTGGAGYDWSTGPEVVAELAEDTPIAQPHFHAGDGLVFDGFLLHRTTQPPPALPERRYAIETWFFRPSSFPSHQQVPVAL